MPNGKPPTAEESRMNRLIAKESTDHGLTRDEADELFELRAAAAQPKAALAATVGATAGADSDRIKVLKPGEKGHPWTDDKRPGKVKPEFEALVPTHRWAPDAG
jgi:hypothetical protein